LRLAGWHIVEIKVHRQFLAHTSPGSLKVDHCHLYLPVWFKIAPNFPGDLSWQIARPASGFTEAVFVYAGPVGRSREALTRLERGARFRWLILP